MTYNQLISKELLDFFTATKTSFVNVISDSKKKWLGYFKWACDEIMDVNKVAKREIPIRKATYNDEYKTQLYVIDYDDAFVTRENDSYCVCVTFDGKKFRVFTYDKVLKNGKYVVCFTERFLDRTSKVISISSMSNYNKLILDVIEIIEKE